MSITRRNLFAGAGAAAVAATLPKPAAAKPLVFGSVVGVDLSSTHDISMLAECRINDGVVEIIRVLEAGVRLVEGEDYEALPQQGAIRIKKFLDPHFSSSGNEN